jgi:hypothetical protein
LYHLSHFFAIDRERLQKYIGEIPQGYLIRHKCDNPKCINPDHLETGTDYDNVQDMIERGRFNVTQSHKFSSEEIQGEKNFNAKLNKDIVIEIFSQLNNGAKQKEIAKKYEISPTAISKMVRGINWTHIDTSQFKNIKRRKNRVGGTG